MQTAEKELVDILANVDDLQWLNLLIQRSGSPLSDGIYVPDLPPVSVQTAFNGTSGEANLRSAFAIYQAIKSAISRWADGPFPSLRVLDFGCGWGRIARFFLKDIPASHLFGVDIADLAVETCRNTLPGNFALINRHPPFEFPENTFDVIYAWSVFSHLPEDLHIQWLRECSRALKYGGLFIASTLPRYFFAECQRLREKNAFDHPWQKAAARSFDDIEAAIREYDRGAFLFSPEPQEEYGMAAIPEAYVQAQWTRFLAFCEFLEEPKSLGQSLIIMKKIGRQRPEPRVD